MLVLNFLDDEYINGVIAQRNIERGREEGLLEGRITTEKKHVKSLYEFGLSVEEISKTLNLDSNYVESLVLGQ